MPRETLNTCVTRLENMMAEIGQKHAELTEKHTGFEGLVKVLLDAQIKTDERFRQTDERIDKLVSEVGELIRRDARQA